MPDTGTSVASDIDLSSAVAGADEYLVRVRLSGARRGGRAASPSRPTRRSTALSLPRLVRGANSVQLVAGPQVETIQFRPPVTKGNHRATVFDENAVDVEKETGYYKPTLRPAKNGEPCSVTWRIPTPTPIVDVSYGATVCVKSSQDRVTMLHSWDGKTFSPDYEKHSDAAAVRSHDQPRRRGRPGGRDQRLPPLRVPDAAQRQELQRPGHPIRDGDRPSPAAGHRCLHARRHHLLLDRTPRVGRRRAAAHAARELAGRGIRHQRRRLPRPDDEVVRLNLHGSGPDADAVVYGYSDGQDVGPGDGDAGPLPLGTQPGGSASPTPSAAQSDKNPDAGGDLTDGIIAPPDTYVSKKYMPTNVIFEKDATSVATIDLGDSPSIAAVRVHAGQEPGFHLAYPARITVETSVDGHEFHPAGRAEHNQVFDPPADFLPWEHDDSPRFASLPAGGRLAYAYRVIFDHPTSAHTSASPAKAGPDGARSCRRSRRSTASWWTRTSRRQSCFQS